MPTPTLTGEGYDCTWGTDFTSATFGVILPKSGKRSRKAKKKLLTDGNGNTVGYKFFDQMEEATLTFEPAAAAGSTGTVTPLNLAPGSRVNIATCINPNMLGNWSVDQFDDEMSQESELVHSVPIFRYVATPLT